MKILVNIFYVGQIVFSAALAIWTLYMALLGLFKGAPLFVTICFAVMTYTTHRLMYTPSVYEYRQYMIRKKYKKMTTPNINMQQDTDRVEICDSLINIIVNNMVNEMKYRIATIEPDYDPSADYDEYWSGGSYDSEGIMELDEPNDEYYISYKFELSWEYRAWTEYWSDPVCYPSFDEMRNENGYVYDIEIETPDGDAVKQSICDAIAKKVNEKIG